MIPDGAEITPARKTVHVAPIYPSDALQKQIEGAVLMEAIIDPEGNVTHVRILESIPELDDAALDAVRQWKYEPTLLEGVAVTIAMTVTVKFELE